jgi:hypothetical protein
LKKREVDREIGKEQLRKWEIENGKKRMRKGVGERENGKEIMGS